MPLCETVVLTPSEQFAAEPYPTKSTTDEGAGQPEPDRAVVVLTSATLPAVALKALADPASCRYAVAVDEAGTDSIIVALAAPDGTC